MTTPTGPTNEPARVSADTALTRTPAPMPPGSPPVRDIALHISRHADAGSNHFQIRLDPPELGRVEVRMELSAGGRLTAVIAVERPETLDLLQRDSRALERSLQDAGLKTDSDSLNFSLKSGRQDGQGGARADNAPGTQADPDADSWDIPLNGPEITTRFSDRAVNIQV